MSRHRRAAEQHAGDAAWQRQAARDGGALNAGAALRDRQQVLVGDKRRGCQERRRHFGNILRQRAHDVARQLARVLDAFGQHAPHQRLAVVEREAEEIERGFALALAERAFDIKRRRPLRGLGALCPGMLLGEGQDHVARHSEHR